MLDRLKRLMPTPETVAGNRWLRWLGPKLLHPRLWHLSRRGVALGAAIGVFFAFITPIAQIPLSAGLCMVLRANVPVSVVATLVNTPPTFAPVYYGAWKLGSWVLGESCSASAEAPPDARPWWQRWGETLREVGRPLLVGTMMFSVGFSLLAYGLVNGVWHWRVRAKRRSRQRHGRGV
jgi:uncharacterized protein (DUF2062 family)